MLFCIGYKFGSYKSSEPVSFDIIIVNENAMLMFVSTYICSGVCKQGVSGYRG